MKPTLVSSDSLNDLLELLKASKLPHQYIVLEKNLFVKYSNDQGNMVGCGGLEFYPPYALLRSVAVAENARGRSLGKQIVNDLLNRAKNRNVKAVYLLTETAPNFFLKRGFTNVAREDAPEELKSSTEFKSVCPVSAACMIYKF